MRIAAILAVFVGFACTPLRAADEKEMKTDDEGFVRPLAHPRSLPFGRRSDRSRRVRQSSRSTAKAPAKLKPKEGDTVKAGDAPLKWTKYEANEHYIDFNAHLGNVTEDSVAYAVCYLVADKPHTGVKLKMGGDDQSKVYLNGKQVLKNTENRGLEKDQDTSEPVELKQGVNVIVFKVINEKADFSGCFAAGGQIGKADRRAQGRDQTLISCRPRSRFRGSSQHERSASLTIPPPWWPRAKEGRPTDTFQITAIPSPRGKTHPRYAVRSESASGRGQLQAFHRLPSPIE